jgi:hypothetical protein
LWLSATLIRCLGIPENLGSVAMLGAVRPVLRVTKPTEQILDDEGMMLKYPGNIWWIAFTKTVRTSCRAVQACGLKFLNTKFEPAGRYRLMCVQSPCCLRHNTSKLIKVWSGQSTDSGI